MVNARILKDVTVGREAESFVKAFCAALGMQKSLGQLKQKGRLDEDPSVVVTFLERQRMVNKPYFDGLEKKYSYSESVE